MVHKRILDVVLPPLALFGLGAISDLSPLSVEERKSNFGAVRSVDDPTRTLAVVAPVVTRTPFRD
jgi:hypothetical protein